ncbi:Uncharacterized membrane protein YoaT, DUF817 family [Nocardiopsis flavescens]|uniref:Uncharacterized membrane protein YoaT, DUF817 family n=1 Tax=Nocardiopsis flavescens TaxID=758803 RepID=A0A1M6VK04_9ACTN|nr:DUF817 domain-containing protein [Nocardiopsis flavescens]SHK81789.1 Uncharacterized membrane protein YoaT, DUF817 family [Nocardiopsis flavescens]
MTLSSLPFPLAQLVRFGLLEARACAFAVCMFTGFALSAAVPLPVPRYDALLLYAVALTALFWALRLETGREIAAIAGFHVVGLAFELFKVHMGSWSYPEAAWSVVWGVPLYSGFMYAAVGSYIVRAWRLLDLGLENYRPRAVTAVAVAIYANFLTHHWLPDLRVPLALLLVAATWGTWVHFTVGPRRARMPLALSFLLIGVFLWVAENIATLFDAWRYPHQAQVWALVHPDKLGAWALLVTVSFVLVALWKGADVRDRGETPEPSR